MRSGPLPPRVAPGELQAILAELGIVPLPKPIMQMSLAEIRKYFGYATTDGIQKTLLMRNLLWQLYGQVKAGNPPDFVKKQGFIRGMWYHIKKKFSQHHPLRGDLYNLMSEQLTLMVRKGLFSYSDFNFRDRDESSWKLGFDNPHLILMGEKDGFVTIMEDLHRAYGCHVLTAGGMPSFMTLNNMVTAMRRYELDLNQTFYLITFADFDPAGYSIANTLTKHLADSGLKNLFLFDQWGPKKKRPWLELAVPANFDKPLSAHKYRLPKATWNDPSTQAWVRLTGGLDGPGWTSGKVTHGLESDEFDLELIHALFARAIEPLLTTQQDNIKKRNAMLGLRQDLENMAIVKFLERLKDAA
ncbi:MAG: hypothetical protein CVV27_04830 [Candidatus Melainabacteria bacterium HGW-Melainabacteria-1]|nr:MAG: hypothetical protein CVV27_04830 [Candidatus Melainabacteria bacterium HGW-Melainabacteria-1]